MNRLLIIYCAGILLFVMGCQSKQTADELESCCSGTERSVLKDGTAPEGSSSLSSPDTAVNSSLNSHDTPLSSSLNPPLTPGEPPATIPPGMVYVPGGITTIGSEQGQPSERPLFSVEMPSFFMDVHPVTVGQFRQFVQETEYRTFSEEIGDGIIFDFRQGTWIIAPGVTWEYPLGRVAGPAPDSHPVTLLTYDDARAYLEWAGKRLPTEIEWEHAARGITNRDNPYSWGDRLVVDGVFMANTWNGQFPTLNTAEDGFLTTAPVGEFGKTELGLTDMGGNVWEWTSSWFRSYADRDIPYNPGPNSEKVLRGGSFMCHISYCHGYRVSARSHTPPDNNMFHIGFRGVMDIK